MYKGPFILMHSKLQDHAYNDDNMGLSPCTESKVTVVFDGTFVLLLRCPQYLSHGRMKTFSGWETSYCIALNATLIVASHNTEETILEQKQHA